MPHFARLLLLLIVAGCGAAADQQPPAAIPSAASTPRVITDLSSLSSAPSPSPIAALPQASIGAAPHQARPVTESLTGDAALRRLFLDQPEKDRFAGTAAAPGEEKLLNAKASRFAEFSARLLHQVFVAAQRLERGEIATAVLPEKLDRVVITATMDRAGKLEELILEQHSGSGVVDQLMIKACKEGLWTSNPPPEAMSDGEYRISIEGRLKNFNTTDQKHWNFETDLGLALL